MDQWQRMARTCPHCGAREPTLGSRCPSCDRRYDDAGLGDGPIDVEDWPLRGAGIIIVPLLSLLNLVLSCLWWLMTLPWRLARKRRAQ